MVMMMMEQKRQRFKQLTCSSPSLKLISVDLNNSYAKSLLTTVYILRNKYKENMSPYYKFKGVRIQCIKTRITIAAKIPARGTFLKGFQSFAGTQTNGQLTDTCKVLKEVHSIQLKVKSIASPENISNHTSLLLTSFGR